MKAPYEVNVSSKYGAPMGRCSNKVQELATVNGKVHLQKVPFVDGCYDPGGAYWGGGTPLFCAWGESEDETVVVYLRAKDRETAKTLLPASCKFYN